MKRFCRRLHRFGPGATIASSEIIVAIFSERSIMEPIFRKPGGGLSNSKDCEKWQLPSGCKLLKIGRLEERLKRVPR